MIRQTLRGGPIPSAKRTNCLNYLLVLLFFVIEYQLRFYFLPAHEHLSFADFCRLLISMDLRRLAR